jgi:stage II sporulation protein D (peptidoglycan lytic transglycosylase)
MVKRLVAILILCISVSVPAVEAVSPQPEMVRVSLMKGVDSIRIGGIGCRAVDDSGRVLDVGYPVLVKRWKDGLTVDGNTPRTIRVTAPAFMQVNGKGYRGTIEIVPFDKGLLIIDELPLEDYLVGLINCEISSQWPIEAIKAQAVVARSYALFQMEARKNAPYQLESSVLDQVYDGCDIEDSRAARGVKETAGEVLTFDDRIIQAFYHSNCGGHTEASENVWGYPLPYLQGVVCNYCLTSGAVKWEQSISLRKLESQLKSSGYQISRLTDLVPGRRNRSGRLSDLVLVSAKGLQTVPATAFRKAIGYSVIKSTNFEVKISGDNVIFTGVGYGHGVGLCQWGAKQRAEDGFDYREILSYYYPGTTLKKLYSER